MNVAYFRRGHFAGENFVSRKINKYIVLYDYLPILLLSDRIVSGTSLGNRGVSKPLSKIFAINLKKKSASYVSNSFYLE